MLIVIHLINPEPVFPFSHHPFNQLMIISFANVVSPLLNPLDLVHMSIVDSHFIDLGQLLLQMRLFSTVLFVELAILTEFDTF